MCGFCLNSLCKGCNSLEESWRLLYDKPPVTANQPGGIYSTLTFSKALDPLHGELQTHFGFQQSAFQIKAMKTEFRSHPGERACLQHLYRTVGTENALVPSCCSQSELMKSQSHSALYILKSL